MVFRLLTVDAGRGAEPALETDGELWSFNGRFRGSGLVELLQNWTEFESQLVHIALDPRSAGLERLGHKPVILSPLRYPAKIVCTMANYYDHLEEMGITNYDRNASPPLFFMRPPSTTLVGQDEAVPIPPLSSNFDWEIELAAVVGKRARLVRAEDALAHIAGYSVAIDLTARDLQYKPDTAFRFDFFSGKCNDRSCPLGPALVPARFVPDPQTLAIELSVNGETQQRSNTSRMIYSVAELVAAASAITTLEPGDVVLTGTPAGVGYPRGRSLKPGDRIKARIESVGELAIGISSSEGASQ